MIKKDMNYNLVIDWADDWLNGREGTLRARWMEQNPEHRDRLIRCVKPSLPLYMKAAKTIDKYAYKHQTSCVFIEKLKWRWATQSLTWATGRPMVNMIKITRNGEYIQSHMKHDISFRHLWKDREIDDNIIETLFAMKNDRFPQPDNIIELPDSYDLFLLQIPDSHDKEQTIDALKYARDTKRYTLFKKHPTKDHMRYWNEFEEQGYVSDYSIYVDAPTDHLVRNADRIYSSDSIVSYNALLYNKPVCTYKTNDFSEIVPMIDNAYEIDNIEPVPVDVRNRFLTWWYYNLCIDINKNDFEERIERRIINHKNNAPIKELLS